jgi:hypothetical protein
MRNRVLLELIHLSGPISPDGLTGLNVKFEHEFGCLDAFRERHTYVLKGFCASLVNFLVSEPSQMLEVVVRQIVIEYILAAV